ncbi:Uma2 family endonuclease [Microcoleus sp. FACHB-672]|uniref:Uma2 family endonuclease n=1 Tax=Microcoleus sp. FACHB-672 TaxID=2692825 RepID=UPI00168A0816|nr:Uma2 family endonuclease [Microcoleus sp. FACHB-672]MBD2042174.1 Uma2 family endonuclease [Microcoleus sp. FACHB-672]
MTVTIPIGAIELTAGSMMTIHNLSWQEFEEILTELGEQRNTRIAYYRGTLEIMSPLALQERPHRIIADIVKAILDAQGQDWEDFGSTTLKQPDIAGVEPDTCFYIQNAGRVRGCTNMNLEVYPPPDLAIESDVTSKTTLNAYQALRVPEVWIYRNRKLTIYILQNEDYTESTVSLIFSDLPITEMIPQLVQKAIEEGTSRMLRALKIQLGK